MLGLIKFLFLFLICCVKDDFHKKISGTLEGKPVGVFIGHLGGITFLDSKEDGRYFLSNSKDQSIKLWDVRKLMNVQPLIAQVHMK
jgi:WD40 repeat protein